MSYETIKLVEDGEVATVLLNRPSVMNAMNSKMRSEMLEVFERFEGRDDLRAVILSGAGKAFCSGGDINEIRELGIKGDVETIEKVMKSINRFVLEILNFSKPLICAVNGIAIGGALSLITCSDIVIASESARFGSGFINIGLVPDMGISFLLPNTLGVFKAKELLYTGKIIDASKAKEIGLVNMIVPDNELISTAKKFAKEIGEKPLRALKLTKRLVNNLLINSLLNVMEMELLMQCELIKSEEHKRLLEKFV